MSLVLAVSRRFFRKRFFLFSAVEEFDTTKTSRAEQSDAATSHDRPNLNSVLSDMLDPGMRAFAFSVKKSNCKLQQTRWAEFVYTYDALPQISCD